MYKFICLVLLLMMPQAMRSQIEARGGRTLTGIVYFTNDTPDNLNTFPVELYTRNRKKRLAATKLGAEGAFRLTGVGSGRYLLKFTWLPDRCTLWYQIDTTKDSNTEIKVIMDTACAKNNDVIQDLPTN